MANRNGSKYNEMILIGFSKWTSNKGTPMYTLDFGIKDKSYLDFIKYNGKLKPKSLNTSEEYLQKHLKNISLQDFEKSIGKTFKGYINKNQTDKSSYLGNIEIVGQ